MTRRNALFLLLAAVLTVVSSYAMLTDGYFAIFGVAWSSPSGAQVFTDLGVALTAASVWMLRDGARRGRNAWPYVLSLPFVGSFGLLAWIAVREYEGASSR